MPFALQPRSDLASELRRVAGEQAARALDALDVALAHPADDVDEAAEDPWDEGVHDARKRCKKIRAVARLCRDALDDAYSPVNAAFRDAARVVSDVRDAWSLVETADALIEAGEDRFVPLAHLHDLRASLLVRYRRVRAAADEQQLILRTRDALAEAAAAIPAWPLPPDLPAAALTPSIERVHARGRAGWHDLADSVGEEPHDTTEEWHDWRKRVKYLWYHVRLLEPAWEEGLAGLEADLDDLSSMVGDDHDLAVLLDVARDEALVDPGTLDRLWGLAAMRRHDLRHCAVPLARRVYAEASDTFAERLTTYMEVAMDLERRDPDAQQDAA